MPYYPEAKTREDALNAYNKRTIEVGKWRIKWKDIFDAKEFYKAIHFWLEEHDWEDHEDGQDHYETIYFEKVSPMGDKELWIRWRVTKFPEGVKNSYYRYHLDLDFHYLYLIPTEVVREGKKFKKGIYKGEVEIWTSAYIEFDYENVWSSHPVLKFFNQIFPKRIFRKDLYEERKRELYREIYVLQNFMKHWFKIKRFLPYEEVQIFHPSMAFPSYVRQ